ncbi:MAG TPA: 6-phosphofructokinase, partial [Anaerolinea sp.]|nr:6-phosphofructokinase [Anaerolinea sp.]
VVRIALNQGARVFAIYEGYQGMVDGGSQIRELKSSDVGGIIQRGGTIIGTARCAAFRTREGRLMAARNLIERGINRLAVIGGDGSLTGANLFRQEWPSLVAELVEKGEISQETADQHPNLAIVGMVGSIDNDFFGTDMTIGADTALNRITAALDQIGSTASSHQRTFVVEVMGRNCGYLALMSALAGTAHWVFIPESPPETDDWESLMCEVLSAGRKAGRRHSMVVIAEGARERYGNRITSAQVCKVLEERLGEDARVTILGHIQRGGAPSAFDRWMSTLVGRSAAEELLNIDPEAEPQVIGMRYNRITRVPLMECVTNTRAVAEAITARDYDRAMELRGGSFRDQFRILRTLLRALPHPPPEGVRRLRLAILTDGAPSPGMNTAVRAAVRMAIDQGHSVLAVHNGFEGLIRNEIEEFGWMDVHGWGSMGGSQLGVSRLVPSGREWYAIAKTLEAQGIEGLLVIGGWSAYEGAHKMYTQRDTFPAFNIPIICLPCSIDNNLPGSELSIGADTALNSIVEVLDKIKESAVATRRCFVVEVMGTYCGYLALMSGLGSGAERVYLNEDGVKLADLEVDLKKMIADFQEGKRLSLLIRNEKANPLYTTSFMAALFEEESHGLFDVRESILGHMQQGGNPSPFDRIQATRLATRCVQFLSEEAENNSTSGAFIGIQGGHVQIHSLDDFTRMADLVHTRQKEQWWLELRSLVLQLT